MRKGGDLREYGNALSGGGYALETRWEDPFTRRWGAEGERRGITRHNAAYLAPLPPANCEPGGATVPLCGPPPPTAPAPSQGEHRWW